MSTTVAHPSNQPLPSHQQSHGFPVNNPSHPILLAAHATQPSHTDIGGLGDSTVQQLQPFYPPLDADASNSKVLTCENEGKLISIPTVYVNPDDISTTTFAAYVFEKLKRDDVQQSEGIFKISGLTAVPKKQNQSLYTAFKNKLHKNTKVEARGAKIAFDTEGCLMLDEVRYTSEDLTLSTFVENHERPKKRLSDEDLCTSYEEFQQGLKKVKEWKQNTYVQIVGENFTLYRKDDKFQMNELADHGPFRFIPENNRFVIVN